MAKQSSAANYYWVGGTGNWNDFANHWATSSGGTTFHIAPPDSTSDVYFDASSFILNNDTIDLAGGSAYSYARSFTLTTLNNPFFKSSGDSIQLYGKMDISGIADFDSVPVPFLFNGSPLDNTIKTGGNRVNIILQNTTSEWNLLDALNGGLRINGGSFNTNNHPLNLPLLFGLTIYNNGHINLGTSECHLRLFYIQPGSTATADADSSFIYCSVSANINNGSLIANNVKFNYVETGVVSADSCSFKNLFAYQVNGRIDTIENLTILPNYPPTFTQGPRIYGYGLGSTYIKKAIINVGTFFGYDFLLRGNITFDTLLLSNPDDNLEIYADDTIKITSLFANNATASNKINVRPYSGNNAYLDFGSLNLCADNLVLQNISALGIGGHNASTGCVDSGGNSGWTFAPCTVTTDVWPGDANYDLTANNFDVLNIGLAYNETGSVRVGASNAWVAQPAIDWSGFFQTAVNKKHADCNGDGLVNSDDTTAISLNYGLIHPARLASNNTINSGIPFYLESSADSANLSDTIYVVFMLGTSTFPVDSIYGIAFTLNYDTTLVDSTGFTHDFSNCWIGLIGSDLLTYTYPRYLQGAIDYALVRTDMNNNNGFGPIGRTGVVIVDNVGARMNLPLMLSNVTAITSSEYQLLISLTGDSVSVDTSATGLLNLQDNHPVMISRNKNSIGVFSEHEKIRKIEAINALGETKFVKNVNARSCNFSSAYFTNGMYIIKITTENNIYTEIFVFQH